MHKDLKTKCILATTVSLSVALVVLLTFVDNQENKATAQVGVLATPSHGALPTPQFRGGTVLLNIGADALVERHSGEEIAVWNPAAAPIIILGDNCVTFPGPSGGTKYQLKADTDLVADGDFTDAGGSSLVAYDLLNVGDAINFEFGDGGFVSIALVNGATIDPFFDDGFGDPDPTRYAWKAVGSVGPGLGDDNTNELGRYDFASCGTEGTNLGSNFQGPTTFEIVGGMIEWEKRLQTVGTPHPLQGGATFRITPDPFDADPFLLVADNDANDKDPDDGQFKLNGTRADTYTITEEIAPDPEFCTVDPDPREVTIDNVADRNQVIGSPLGAPPGTDDESPGDVNERDFHNDCRGMIEWEKRKLDNGPPHLLQGGATFRITPDPFDGVGNLDVLDNGANDDDPDAGQIKVSNVLIGAYTVREQTAPPNCSKDPDTRTVTVSLPIPIEVIGSEPLGAPPGTDDESPGDVNERDFHNICEQIIKIIKDTLPDDPTDFRFNGDLGPFTLDDDTNPTRSNMITFSKLPGTYRVTETEVGAFPLRAIRCIDPSGDTTVNLGSATANIKLAAGETVTCTFVNGEFPPPCVEGSVAAIQPEDPISMDTIVGKSDGKKIAKTIHVEKQIFDCETTDGVPVIADVTIMAEIFEDMNTRSVIHKQVEVITCLKQEAPARLKECSLSIPDLDPVVVINCREDPISHPQEMNTVTKGNGNGIIKTIEAQKEVFLCNLDNTGPDEKKVDLVLFTEIWENLVSLDSTPTDPTTLKTYLSMRCVIKIETVTVEACAFTQPKQIFP